MNFVDVQPNFSLDYAWTSPSPTVMSAAKSSKTNRKQNRCCDQCRKGKRACDAAILEDTLLDDNNSNGSPTTFHYSDVFGPLAPCGNCEKTKKTCTFEWLKSQRIAQSTQPAANPTPPTKRRRVSGERSTGNKANSKNAAASAGPSNQVHLPIHVGPGQGGLPLDFGTTFADFAGGPSAFDADPSLSFLSTANPSANPNLEPAGIFMQGTFDDKASSRSESEKTSSIEAVSEKAGSKSPFVATTKEARNTPSTASSKNLQRGRKRSRRGSSSSISNGAPPYPAISFASHIVASTSNALLTENLLRIYHNSFENALSCWVTERTCPYTTKADVSLSNGAGPDWNRIYHRVFRLDRLAANIKGRQLTHNENTAASKALNLAIYAFATQWAQSSKRRTIRYPFHAGTSGRDSSPVLGSEESSEPELVPDRDLQINAWHEAESAIQKAAELDSFRVALAQIIFALTQRPSQRKSASNSGVQTQRASRRNSINASGSDKEVSECEDLMSKLNLAIEADTPPIHLEQGLRSIHSLRTRLSISRNRPRSKRRISPSGKHYSTDRLDPADRATIDLLFWIGVMFDTLSSAMNKRPLVVSDEDSDMHAGDPEVAQFLDSAHPIVYSEHDDVWNGHIFANRDIASKETILRWPCSLDEAAKLLCDAAPVKVILFRKVTRIQTLLARNFRGAKIEASIDAALKVYRHWQTLYAPFIQDCVQCHDQLHPRIQSWYTCLAGHWHLAALLLADIIEISDEEQFGLEANRNQRTSSNFLAHFREENSRIIADIAHCACPRDETSQSFNTVLHKESLLTEPWTAVLIRAFAKAGVAFLEADTMLPASTAIDHEDNFQRADDCIRALWYLGRKSDSALSAAKLLGNALKERRKGAQGDVNDITSLIDDDIWHGFADLAEEFGIGCDL